MNDQTKDTQRNSDWTDPVFDSLLEEVVTGAHPPDLLTRITTAWQQELASRIPLPTASVASGELIAPPIVAQAASSNFLPQSNSGVHSFPKEAASRSHAWQVLLVVAASGLLIAGAIQWRLAFAPSNEAIVTVPKGTTNEPVAGDLAAANKKISDTASDSKVASEKLTLDNVPFNSPSITVPEVNEPVKESLATSRLNDLQIVELIDTQLSQLWQRLNVVPSPRLDDQRLAQTLSQTLTGQELPTSTVAEFSELKPIERRERVIAMAFDSQAFARRIARELVAGWLRGGSVPMDSEPAKKLEEFVAGGIAAGRPWDEVVSNVLSGNSPAGDVFVSSMAGGGNHRLASQLSGSFLDSSLTCVRCHEAKTSIAGVASQQQYWSLVAMLVGLDAVNVDKSKARVAVDKQSELFASEKLPNLFFDRPDGTLEAAKFELPDGQPWQSIAGARTPRAALARWIGTSDQADAAIVNQVWQIALGRPLVQSSGLVDDVGLIERSDLQKLLAQQFRAHGRNLPQLVGWIVRSEAFARDSLGVDRNRWLQATEENIDNWHLAEMAFAARSSLGDSAVKGGLESSLAALVKWNQSSAVGTDGASVLAQPSLDPKIKLKNAVKSNGASPAIGYVIHRGRLSKGQRNYIDRLVASKKLSWEQKVEHVVSLSPGNSATSNVKRMADELLKSLDDPTDVLTELFWAVQNADAS